MVAPSSSGPVTANIVRVCNWTAYSTHLVPYRSIHGGEAAPSCTKQIKSTKPDTANEETVLQCMNLTEYHFSNKARSEPALRFTTFSEANVLILTPMTLISAGAALSAVRQV